MYTGKLKCHISLLYLKVEPLLWLFENATSYYGIFCYTCVREFLTMGSVSTNHIDSLFLFILEITEQAFLKEKLEKFHKVCKFLIQLETLLKSVIMIMS